MDNAIVKIPAPRNEPILGYGPGSAERSGLRLRLAAMRGEGFDIPLVIGGREVRTGATGEIRAPHETALKLGQYHKGAAPEAAAAIDSCLAAREGWARMPWEARAAVFLKAADLLAGPWRDTVNAATMLGQSKNAFQSEIDAACELIDFFRFNVHYAAQIYQDQPFSPPGNWNQLSYRPLEGFVFAVPPFNFTSISGNLPTAPVIMGNVAIWKPASTAVLSSYLIYQLLAEAGLPPGVINFLPGSGAAIGDPVFASEHLAGLHFTGSTATFQHMWQTMAANLGHYRAYPRIVGETGGKDFVLAHPSADVDALAVALVRGAFEYQGQKCSAASRAYIPRSLWPAVEERVQAMLADIRMGSVEDFGNFVNAVIDQPAFDKISGYIAHARQAAGVKVIAGGKADGSTGWFIEPTVILAEDPGYRSLCEEIFGPVLSVHVFDDARLAETMALVDTGSPYALTGAIFAQDRAAIVAMARALENSAGNFYINDKPTGAVVGQQPFGGARASGTNDKAGSYLNLVRWVSARAIKETFVPPRDYRYPFLAPDPS